MFSDLKTTYSLYNRSVFQLSLKSDVAGENSLLIRLLRCLYSSSLYRIINYVMLLFIKIIYFYYFKYKTKNLLKIFNKSIDLLIFVLAFFYFAFWHILFVSKFSLRLFYGIVFVKISKVKFLV